MRSHHRRHFFFLVPDLFLSSSLPLFLSSSLPLCLSWKPIVPSLRGLIQASLELACTCGVSVYALCRRPTGALFYGGNCRPFWLKTCGQEARVTSTRPHGNQFHVSCGPCISQALGKKTVLLFMVVHPCGPTIDGTFFPSSSSLPLFVSSPLPLFLSSSLPVVETNCPVVSSSHPLFLSSSLPLFLSSSFPLILCFFLPFFRSSSLPLFLCSSLPPFLSGGGNKHTHMS